MNKNLFPVEKMCQVFKVSQSAYYSWNNGDSSIRKNQEKYLLELIEIIYAKSHKTYGSPRIFSELKAEQISVSRSKVARIMKKHSIRSVHAKKFKVTTDSKHKHPVAENILDRNFHADHKGEKWVSDITYIQTKEGWLYLTSIMDLYDRKVIGWAMSKGMKASETVVPAWKMATTNRAIMNDLIFHSDQGVQYACTEFTDQLKNPLITQSMSRKGNCWDNAVAESFFKSLKKECVYRNKYLTRNEAKLSVFQWIETWYNTNRRHSSLGNKSIKEFEKSINNHNLAA
jgi:transposase InsO family protein